VHRPDRRTESLEKLVEVQVAFCFIVCLLYHCAELNQKKLDVLALSDWPVFQREVNQLLSVLRTLLQIENDNLEEEEVKDF
jgi:hypothetical protein